MIEPGRQHPAGQAQQRDRRHPGHRAGQGRVLQPGRLGEGPDRAADDRGRRGVRRAPARRHDRRADLAATPASGWPSWPSRRATTASSSARTRSSTDKINVLRAYGAEVVVCPTAVAPEHPRLVLQRLRPAGPRDPGRLEARPVQQPEQPALALRDHRPRAVGADRRPDHPLRRGRRHRRHHHRHRPLPEGGQRRPGAGSSAPTRRARSTPAAPGGRTWSRASARTSGRAPTTGTSPTRSSRSPTRTPSR